MELAVDRLRDEAMTRAIEGIENPVFHRGEPCGTVRQVSDRLLMFLLRAHRPERYEPHYVKPYEHPPAEIEALEIAASETRVRAAMAFEQWMAAEGRPTKRGLLFEAMCAPSPDCAALAPEDKRDDEPIAPD